MNPLPVTRYPLPFTLYPLPFTRYPLPFTLYHLPFTLYPLLFTLYPLPCARLCGALASRSVQNRIGNPLNSSFFLTAGFREIIVLFCFRSFSQATKSEILMGLGILERRFIYIYLYSLFFSIVFSFIYL